MRKEENAAKQIWSVMFFILRCLFFSLLQSLTNKSFPLLYINYFHYIEYTHFSYTNQIHFEFRNNKIYAKMFNDEKRMCHYVDYNYLAF